MLLEFAGRLFVHGDDSLAVSRTVLVDMVQCFLQRRYGFDGHFIVHELSTEGVGSGSLQQHLRIDACQYLI